MCNAVRFTFENHSYTINIRHPRPALPVLMADKRVEMFPWGRHTEQPGKLPYGFTIKRDSIRAGKWDYWFPKRALIPFDAFMMIDFEQRDKWYENAMKSHLVGLIAKEGNERRVYIVMDGPDVATEPYHELMPLTSSLSYRN